MPAISGVMHLLARVALNRQAETAFASGIRSFASAPLDLKATVKEMIPIEQMRLKSIKTELSTKELGKVTVESAIGGMRGITGILWETSLLDADEGIRFRGYSIPELQAALPAAKAGGEPLPEAMLWLLMTGKVPTQAQTEMVVADLKHRAKMPDYIVSVLESFPKGMHPMTQFSMLVLALQTESKFAKAYGEGIHKSLYWDPVYEDSMDLIAKLPQLAAMIYRREYKGGKYIERDESLDWAGNLAHMMGFNDTGAMELMRLYQTIHSDHEGGNVSAHTTHLVGSALSDPYYSLSAGLNGLAGPLHGLANQEVLRWLITMEESLGSTPTKEEIATYVKETLAKGKVVPGYGHAVLRKTDPRYTCQREFALKHMPDYPMFKLVSNVFEVVPDILLATGKVKNPWPNVDAHSGVLLQHYGIKEANFYTVLFGVSRALGVLSQGIWSRALGLPIERPKSITMEKLLLHKV